MTEKEPDEKAFRRQLQKNEAKYVLAGSAIGVLVGSGVMGALPHAAAKRLSFGAVDWLSITFFGSERTDFLDLENSRSQQFNSFREQVLFGGAVGGFLGMVAGASHAKRLNKRLESERKWGEYVQEEQKERANGIDQSR